MELYKFLLFFALISLGAVYGWFARERHAKRTLDRYIAQAKAETQTVDSSAVVKITIEKHNDIFYVYDTVNTGFMAQGYTRAQLETALARRYPDVYFAATPENLKVFDEPI